MKQRRFFASLGSVFLAIGLYMFGLLFLNDPLRAAMVPAAVACVVLAFDYVRIAEPTLGGFMKMLVVSGVCGAAAVWLLDFLIGYAGNPGTAPYLLVMPSTLPFFIAFGELGYKEKGDWLEAKSLVIGNIEVLNGVQVIVELAFSGGGVFIVNSFLR